MRRQLIAGMRMLAILTLVTGLVYPLTITGIARVVAPSRADGSQVSVDGRVVGSSLIGQRFTGAGWFHGRPDPYDPSASGASNLGPTNPDLQSLIAERTDALAAAGARTPIPADAVTGSGSGLDPHISPEFARLQAPRVAAARGLPPASVLELIEDATTGRTFGVLGEPRVNVLELNIALERLASGS